MTIVAYGWLSGIAVWYFQETPGCSPISRGTERAYSYVSEGGWATMPGSATNPDRKLAAACAEELDKLIL